jgi:GT2 family glycosyltransferase
MKNKIKKIIRPIYQKFPFLKKLKFFIFRLKDSLNVKKYLPTSSAQNKLALDHLTERRFTYTENYFSQLVSFDRNNTLPYIDISVVTYNSSKWVDQFINSLVSQTFPLDHINLYFVDNGSKDNTPQKLEEAKESNKDRFASWHIIQHGNLGFGAGHDRAIQASQSEFCLISNIDLIFEKFSILNAVKTALIDTNEDYASWEFRQIPFEHPKYYDPITLETNWSSHACILIRRSAYIKVGGYEPKIFMYAEDVELSYRFRAYGYHLKYCPTAVVRHFTYEHKHQIKPLQFSGSTLGNAYLRLRYGNRMDKLAIAPLYLALIGRKELFKGSRKIVFHNIVNILKNKNYFTSFVAKNQDFYAPFREFDYELIRDGAFYTVDLLITKPLVSIIVRTYQGRDQLLRQCLLSILNQTYTNIEIIVVEDGGETMRPIVDLLQGCANIQYHALPKVGRSVAGNFGLANCKGSSCLFLDDDDLIFADHIEILVSALQKHSDASASYSLAYLVPTNMNKEKSHYTEENYTTPKLFYQPFEYEVLNDHNYFPIQSVLFKKELFLERGGFDESLTYLEDWNLWLRYAYNNTFVYVPKTTSLYRIPAKYEMQDERHAFLYQAYNDAKAKAISAIKELKL